MARHQLTDDQWDLIEEFLVKPPAKTGRPRVDRRRLFDGILWIVRTGAPWRDLPAEFGKWETVYYHFKRWSTDGTLDNVLKTLQASFVGAEIIDDDLWCVDGTTVRAARCAAGAKKGA